jgi:hypothetical protein
MHNCQFCGKESKKPNLRSIVQHELRCDSNPNKNTNLKIPSRKGKISKKNVSITTEKRRKAKLRKQECFLKNEFVCNFCSKNIANDSRKLKNLFGSLMIHEAKCHKNPQGCGGKEVSKETREKISKALKGKKLSNERRKKLSESMKKAVADHPESYSTCKGRVKKIKIDGITLDGSWELEFYQWAKNAGLDPQRGKKKFPYVWNGNRTYFPDFYIPSLNVYVEIKGYETERDRAKWSQFPERLIILKGKEIEKIKQGNFKLN